MKILVIDDDRRLLAAIADILGRHNFSGDYVDNADEAVKMVTTSQYDFILLDYRMPEHDGLWFLKNANIHKNTKILLVTSYADRHLIRQMFHAGIAGYIMKPFDEEELIRHLEFHADKGLNVPVGRVSA